MIPGQNIKTYEVGFSTEKLRHIFYISCHEDVDAKTFAHAVFHYYDVPAEWGNKSGITTIAEVKPSSCVPDYLHIGLQDRKELAMPEDSEELHAAVRKTIRQMMNEGCVPMAIYDQEKGVMTVYATKKLEVEPQEGVVGAVLNFSLFGGAITKKR